ncbi:hypothetical protein [Peribacillus frigoritolerans]|nr:hypothetical protein [Peribacillus frigoritolerans]
MDYFDLLRREDINGLNEFLIKTNNLNEELKVRAFYTGQYIAII